MLLHNLAPGKANSRCLVNRTVYELDGDACVEVTDEEENDFGDLVRTGANPATEDETDLSKIHLDVDMFERIAGGFMSSARDFLNPVEIEHLVFGAKLMVFENCIRFLTDHLAGDVYFKIHRENHNLDRCRTQMTMVADMERKMEQLQSIIANS